MEKLWLRFSIFTLALLALSPAPVQADRRIVELVSMTAQVAETSYTMETLKSAGPVAVSAPVFIEARVKSTALATESIEVIAELDPATVRWRLEDVRTSELTPWKYDVTRLRLPPPPFDIQVIVQGRVRAVEEPGGVFKPYMARLFRIDVGGVAEVDYQAKAVHPTAIVLGGRLKNAKVPGGPTALSAYLATLKRHVAESLEAGKIAHAESLMGVLEDLAPVAVVTMLTDALVTLAGLAAGGWALWLLSRRRVRRESEAKVAYVNDRLESLWR